ncbi:NAD-dependent epimerase/dehydratase family protein [Mucilaginibacter glaciei]|uniref:Epimerase n=1 Tax=Mucilaginibacter glaciei TaxID=2772109 RepID=A0A926S3D3_9SPHI|nr:NAD-dependent epimerase/dehydratase family protein [Mucilaginibacter glaciei]MBD1394812.1 epimerase [Mucilaginibacter glaciei]
MGVKLILTGATGLVGEGVLLECLQHPQVESVLIVNRKPYKGVPNAKLKEVIVADFFKLENVSDQLKGYDACLYCAGVSSNGVNEADYTRITVDIPLHFANVLLDLNPGMIFSHVSGSHTDGSEKGKIMWARVKGKVENALMKLPFKNVYNFRPGFMKPTAGQQNIKGYYKVINWLSPLLKLVFPGQLSTMREVGLAMINSVLRGYAKQVLEVVDIKALAKSA